MVKPRIVSALAIAGALLPTIASGQTLSAAYRAALARDPEWLGAREDAAAASEGDAQARALFRPKVGVQAGASYTHLSADVDLPPPIESIDRLSLNGGGYNALVQVQQPLIDGAARAQQRQLRAGARAAEAQLAGAQQRLILRVAEAWFAVLAARDELASLETQEASARREQRSAQARFNAGRAKITDVREAQARGDGAAAQAVAATARVDTAAAQFFELTGLDGSAVVPLRTDLAAVPPAETLAVWQERGEKSAPAVTARSRAVDAAQARADQYGWRQQIKVDGVGMYGQNWSPGGGDQFASVNRVGGYSAGLRLTMPLYTGGGQQSQQRQAAAQARSAQQALDTARRDVRMTIQQAWTGQSSSVAGIAALRTALASARLQEQAAITGRDVGVRTQSDVLLAQSQVIDRERQLNDAVRNYERSRLSLYAAAGTLGEEQLRNADRDLVTR